MSTPPEPPPGQPGTPKGPQVNVVVPDAIKLGQYSNFLVVSHGPHEFTLDFCQLIPSGEQGKVRAEVVSRLKVAPTLVGKLIQALNTNLTGYEDQFGIVRETG